ncbi:hypothetical protein ABZ478_20075 [Streptomyces sp. NPDC005706]|uniref:hypothetical protein n=1 Tax=Streptomyces sp. NPDC005706 TaxID=3157169 RepID=UPI0034105D9C
MFTTQDAFHQALTATGTLNGLYTALMASTPSLSERSHEDQTTGLVFFEQNPSIRLPAPGDRLNRPDIDQWQMTKAMTSRR